jgi:hypothetical protein
MAPIAFAIAPMPAKSTQAITARKVAWSVEGVLRSDGSRQPPFNRQL